MLILPFGMKARRRWLNSIKATPGDILISEHGEVLLAGYRTTYADYIQKWAPENGREVLDGIGLEVPADQYPILITDYICMFKIASKIAL